ncbi:protoheme IX farnesyltransferase [Fibrobacterota bacterium]
MILRLLTNLSSLLKIKVSLAVSLSALTGYLLGNRNRLSEMAYLSCGVFLLACAASAANQYQERKYDSLMNRTRMRPLAAGTMKKSTAVGVTLGMLSLGFGCLLLINSNHLAVCFLGAAGILWYNGIYTGLKRRSPFTVVPGALVGAVPPLMGMSASDIPLWDSRVLIIALFFMVWQIPHFWLSQYVHHQDYQAAGFPTLSGILNTVQTKRLFFIWVAATAFSGMTMAVFIPLFPVYKLVIIALSLALIYVASFLFKPQLDKKLYKQAALMLNVYAFAFMAVFILNALSAAVLPRLNL